MKSSNSILLIISFLFLGLQINILAKAYDSSNKEYITDYDGRNNTYTEGYGAFTNYVDNREDVNQSIQRSLNSPVKYSFKNVANEKDISPIIKNEILHYSNFETGLLISLHKIKLIFPFNYFW